MKRRFASIGMALVFAATLMLPGSSLAASKPSVPVNEEVHAYFNFQQGTMPWKATTDSPYHKFWMEQAVGTACADMQDWHYARLVSSLVSDAYNPTPPYRMATWTMSAYPISGYGHRLVTISWFSKNDPSPTYAPDATVPIYPIIYVGATAPTKATQFTTLYDRPLKDRWNAYTYQADYVLPDKYSTVFVALGWDGVQGAIGLDCVDISVTYWPTMPSTK